MPYVRPPLNGFGAKGEANRLFRLYEFMPPLTDHKKIYFEPFAFTASTFFCIDCRSAIINDIDNEIMNFWHVMINQRDEFAHKLKPIWIGTQWYAALQHIIADTHDPVYRAIFFYMCNRMSFSGVPTTEFKYKFLVKTLEKDFSTWQKIIDDKYSFAMWNDDFRVAYDRLLNQHGGDHGRIEYYVYCDPPYVTQGKNYSHPMTKKDHTDLAEYHNALKNNPNCFFLISYDDDPLVRELYHGWHIQEVGWKTGAKARKKEDYHELLISNRPLRRHTHSLQYYQTKKETNITKFL